MDPDPNSEKLLKHLCRARLASRRDCFRMIREGRVRVDGQIVDEPSFPLPPGARVMADGRPTAATDIWRVALHKPAGYVCTTRDRHAKRKVTDLVHAPDARLFPAGRLDKDSEGLIALTNDGDYANQLVHPSSDILKTYLVQTPDRLSRRDLAAMEQGFQDQGEFLKAERAQNTGDGLHALVLAQGRKREIRRMFARRQARVTRLIRVGIGELTLENLKPGQWRHMDQYDIERSLRPGVSVLEWALRKRPEDFAAETKT